MPTRLQWTPELVSRFWNGLAETTVLEIMGFAALAGPVLLEFMAPWIKSQDRCLDYGGGSGELVGLMIEAGYRTAMFEPSINRLSKIKARIQEKPGFLGIISSDDATTFDFVVCSEVIEHILVPDTDNFMRSLTRKIAPGGLLFLTTPFAENLSASDVYCPCCDHLFHRWQHQRSWRIKDVEGLMTQWGLKTEWKGLVGFDDSVCVRDFHLRRQCGEQWPRCYEGKTPLIGRGDHIVYIGRKPIEPALSLSDPERLISAGLAVAKATGTTPIVVDPSSVNQIDAAVAANDLIEEHSTGAKGGGTNDERTESELRPEHGHDAIIVWLGSIELLQRAIEQGYIPRETEALVFEDQWRRARPVAGRDAEIGNFPSRGSRNWTIFVPRNPRIVRQIQRILRQIQRYPYARRVQPWLDRREGAVRSTLLSPHAFPYRLSHFVERRVVLGIASLGSGGAEKQMVNTAQGLRARGLDDVHLLVEHLHDLPENAFYLEEAKQVATGVHAVPNDVQGIRPWSSVGPEFRDVLGNYLMSRVLSAAAVIKKVAPEIVHTSLDWTNITIGIAAVLAGVPKIFVSGRNLAPTHFEFFQWFMYPCYRALAAHPGVRILNNSNAGRRDYARWLKLKPAAINVVRNGLATEEFPIVDNLARRAARSQFGIGNDVRVVAGAFRLSAEKRPLLWIQTAAKIEARLSNVIFLLCGIGPMEAQVRSKVAALGLESCIRFLGVRKDIHTVFSSADLVLQTSLQEGTPNTLIEAQAMGIPVVTTAAFGAAETVDHGVTGLVVRDDTSTGLADAAVSILTDPAFGRSAQVAGPKFIEARFGFDRMVDETLLAYSDGGATWAVKFLPEPVRRRAYVPIDAPIRNIGHAWTVQLPANVPDGDGPDDTPKSNLRLFEDEVELGPPYAPHDEIRQLGGGRYSHWGRALYFSTSDNTSPLLNGRSYAIRVTAGK
jgi:glycosyltransferase involved in cell wall biosynthesis/2-polyprenyl-3-methyl-5-hydroxy-6-metoxy-1,4-benzoquinol methylase